MPGRNRRARRVEHHGEEAVVALNADEVDDALLTKPRQGTGIDGVGDRVRALKLVAEIIDDGFVLGQRRWPAAVQDGGDGLARDAGLARDRRMDVPLVVL